MHTAKYLYLVGLFLLISCNSNSQSTTDESAPESTQSEAQAAESVDDTGIKFKSKGIQTIYGAYEKLRDALVATDYETAKAMASDLSEALKAEESTMQQASMADGIVSAGEIEAARAVFSKLTESIEGVFAEALVSGEINICFCPMALDNTGASWFSTTKEIKNPYFGDKMLKCGSVKKTLKQ